MPKENLATVFPRLTVSEKVAQMLGTTVEAIRKMDLHTFAVLVYDKGYVVSVNCNPAVEGEVGGLTIRAAESSPQQSVG